MALSGAFADEPDELLSSPTATAFGSQPTAWSLRLAPDGTKLSFLQLAPGDQTVVMIVDLVNGGGSAVLANDPESYEFGWCDWASDSRILCGAVFRAEYNGIVYPATRLVAVNADGSELTELVQPAARDSWGQTRDRYAISVIEDRIVDWLPDDPEHVLVENPERGGQGLSRLDIHSRRMTTEERLSEGILSWLSDGHGTARLYQELEAETIRWFVRDTSDSPWSVLYEHSANDIDETFAPIGFGEDRGELLFFDRLDGRIALFKMDLANRERSVVYAHPSSDVAGIYQFGRYKRLGAVAYMDERPRLHFFDQTLQGVHERVAAQFPDQVVSIVDEDWDGRYYLFFVSSPENAGDYYRFDARDNVLLKLFPAYSSLDQRKLLPMKALSYEARDGTLIPAYLTLPERGGDEPVSAIVLPHGGPSSRDVWSYDFLAQYLAANGHAVLQANYRGSGGYGSDWLGRGGFRDWRIAVGDIVDGTQYLIDEGIASPDKLCTVGWSYGGYVALLSALEASERFKCIVSIAGVTDPESLGSIMRRNYVGGFGIQTFIGTDEEALRQSSPLARADEFDVPVLLFHPAEDMNVPFSQGRSFFRALDRAGKEVAFIEYENAAHSIHPQRYRIDMLTRVGRFLDRHIGAR
jgi:dipeptidyl aminopeptidase/acylaminoacyl peptidase